MFKMILVDFVKIDLNRLRKKKHKEREPEKNTNNLID